MSAFSGREFSADAEAPYGSVVIACEPGTSSTGRTCASWGRSPDVRRLRHPRARPRRRPRHLLRAVRAPAPRPGVGRDRRLRRGPPDRPARHGPRHAGLRRAEAPRPARRRGDRPHALLDDRLDPVGERAAADPARPRAHRRARAQRQPRQRRRATRAARGRGDHARHDLRHRADRRADRQRPGADRGRGGQRDGQARGRVLVRRPLGRQADRLPRPPRLPAALPRPRGRPLAARVRDERARQRRRRGRAGAGARRAGRDRRGGCASRQALEPAGGGALCIFEFFYLARPDSRLADRGPRRACAHGRAAGRGGAGRGRPRAADPRLGHACGDRLLARERDPVLARA